MNVIVRPATMDTDPQSSCIAVRRSIVECCREDHRGNPKVLAAWLKNKTPAQFSNWFNDENRYAAVAERTGEVVGVSLASCSGEIQLLYLVPESLHQGVGKALLFAMEAWIEARGIDQIYLSSTQTGKRFYLRNGYELTGESAEHFGVTSTAMIKRLTGP